MLSRLKRRAASNAAPPDAGPSVSPSPSPSSASFSRDDGDPPYDGALAESSPAHSRHGSPERARRPNRHSFATPVRAEYADAAAADPDEVGRTLSPTRAYAHAQTAGRTSRSSSVSSHAAPGSAQSRRSSVQLQAPSDQSQGSPTGPQRGYDIGHGSLSLEHLAPGGDEFTPMTLVVHAPEHPRAGGDSQEWLEDDNAPTPVVPPSDSPQRTPLAPPRSLSVPMDVQGGIAPTVGAPVPPTEYRHRALTTGDVRFVPPSKDGLDALAAINQAKTGAEPKRGSLPPAAEAAMLERSRTPRSGSLSPTASRSGSRSVSRRSSMNLDEGGKKGRARSATTSSPSRPRSKSTAQNGIAAALAQSGATLAAPSHNLRLPSTLAPISPNVRDPNASGHYDRGSEPSSPAIDTATAPPMSARNSLESHMHMSPGLHDTEEFSEYPSSVYGDHGSAFLSMDQLGDFDDVVSQLGTGYAVASSKRNADFHALFRHIPDDDYLIEDYGCALQREILIQGRLYISEHHLSFNANIFGWVTSLTIPFSEVVKIEKRSTAYVIPNAIQITTLHARHVFASFLSRDTTYDLIGNIWRMVHPVVPMSAALPDTLSTANHAHYDSDDEGGEAEPSPDGVVNASGFEAGTGSERRVRDRAKRKLKGLSGRRRAATDAAEKSAGLGALIGAAGASAEAARVDKEGAGSPTVAQPHAPTVDTCPTLKNLKEVCMDTTFPGKPEKIYNLMFTSGFMKDFWTEDQKLTEIQIGDWAPQSSGSKLLARSMSYIKPLNGSIGPKQTKCLITDESAHVDFDDFVCVITTTRTPDVPSGNAFAVKTRTSMTWGRGNKCRVVVTTGVEWTKSSFIKGIIEKSCIEGQKTYHTDLEKAMRAYISTHRNEFTEDGQDPDAALAAEEVEAAEAEEASIAEETAAGSASTSAIASLASSSGALGPVWSVVEPLFQSLAQQSATSLILGAVVVVLLISNLWTLRGRDATHDLHPAERARRRVLAGQSVADPALGDGAVGPSHEVANAVRDVLDNYFAAAAAGSTAQKGPVPMRESAAGSSPGATALPVNKADRPRGEAAPDGGDAEIDELALLLDRVEERASRLREELAARRTALAAESAAAAAA